jgi:hypothetical protein
MRMNRLLLVFVAILWLVVTSTMAGPDNIVFPSSYKNHVRYARVDHPDNKTIREIYIAPASAKVVKAGEPLPHGTVITMEVYRARADEKGEPAKDAEFVRDLTGAPDMPPGCRCPLVLVGGNTNADTLPTIHQAMLGGIDERPGAMPLPR